MAISTVDIVNKGLNYLAVPPIASLNEDSEPAQRANAIYESTRDDLPRSYAWGFATKITTLAQLSGETVPGWDYLYLYPSDCLRVRKFFEDITVPVAITSGFRQVLSPTTSQRCLAASITPAYVEYTAKVTDPSFYDPSFVKTLALALAMDLAHMLTGKESLVPMLQNMFTVSISEAKRLDSIEHKVDDSIESTYLQARG